MGIARIKLTESQLRKIIGKSFLQIIKESNNKDFYDEDFYSEEDFNGDTGEPGMVRSYDIGYMTISDAERDAEECGYDNVEDFLRYWWSEISPDCPWYWIQRGSGYGFNGRTIFKENGVRFKDIYGQIIVDGYPS